MATSTDLPMVRLNLLAPIVARVKALGVDPLPVLRAHQLSHDKVDDASLFVPARTMYSLVEALAESSGDPYFGVHAGEKLDPWSWPPLARAAEGAATVGDFLLRFSLAAGEEASSIVYTVETAGKRSTFAGRRTSDTGIQPRHNDGFSIAYMLRILYPAVGEAWEGQRVLARVCDPSVVPGDYLGIRLAASGSLGFSLDFPTEWLLLPPALGNRKRSGSRSVTVDLPLESTVASLHHALVPHLQEPDLDAARVAGLFGISKRTLARRLAAEGTTLGAELGELRKARARDLLAQRDLAVARVGEQVGYPDPAVFARAFKRWTGQSPSDYRRALAGSRSSN